MRILNFRFLSLVLALGLSACATRDGALCSWNYERVHIEGATSNQIIVAANKAFAAHGFRSTSDTIPQELVLTKKTSLLFRPIKGGDAVVWLILEPRAKGWDLYCVPEPSHLYPGGSAVRFNGVLRSIEKEVQPERN